MTQNPYESPLAVSDATEHSIRPDRGFIGKSWLLLALALRLLFRFGGVAFVVLILLIHTKGTPINWSNVRPVFALIGLGCLLTHVIPLKTKHRWIAVTAGPGMYLAALTLGGFVFVNGLYPAGV